MGIISSFFSEFRKIHLFLDETMISITDQTKCFAPPPPPPQLMMVGVIIIPLRGPSSSLELAELRFSDGAECGNSYHSYVAILF